MNCKKVKPLLYSYVENGLSAEEKSLIKAHILKCAKCKRELAYIKKYKKNLESLAEVKAPKNFLLEVRERLEEPSPIRKIINMIFLPWQVKLPVEAAGLIAILFLVNFLIKAPFDVAPEYNAKYAFEEQKKEIPAADMKQPELSKRKKPKDAIVASNKISTPQAKSVIAPPPAIEMNRSSIETFDNKILEKSVTYEISMLIASEPKKSMNDEKLAGPGKSAEYEESKPESIKDADRKSELKSSAKSEETGKKIQESGPQPGTIEKIKYITRASRGRILKIEYSKETNLPLFVILEIPAKNHTAFIRKLHGVGLFRDSSSYAKDRDIVILKISILYSK